MAKGARKFWEAKKRRRPSPIVVASTTKSPGAPRRKILTSLKLVDLDPYITWTKYECWKAAQSNCKADACLFKKVNLSVLSTQIFAGMMKEMLGFSLSRLNPTAHPEAHYSEVAGVRSWTVSIRDLERLTEMCDFAQAKADASVGTARPSRLGNYNAIVEVEFKQTHKLDPRTWSARKYLTMRIWMATMNKTGAVTVPPARYTAEEVAEIETYMQTLTAMSAHERAMAARAIERRAAEQTNHFGLSHGSYLSYLVQWVGLENFICAVLPLDHPDRIMVMRWRGVRNEDGSWLTPPSAFFNRPLGDSLDLFYGMYMSPKGKQCSPKDAAGNYLYPLMVGRGVRGASIRQISKAISFFHLTYSYNPATGKPWARKFHVEREVLIRASHKAFEIVNGLTEMRRICFDDKGPFAGKPNLQVYVWFALQFQSNLIKRVSDFTYNGSRLGDPNATNQVPCAMDIKLPHDVQSNICHEATPALPAFVHISMIGQKGDNVNCQDPLRGPTVVRLSRNNLEGQQGFCPIVAMFEFVQLGMLDVMAANSQKPPSEQVFVPLFPAYDADLDSFHYYKPILASEIKTLIQMVLDKCKWLPEDDVSQGERITPHGIRSSATVAALRAGHEVVIVMQGGGWNPKSFGSVFTYANQNRIYAEDFKRLGKPDPMFRFWTYAVRRELREGADGLPAARAVPELVIHDEPHCALKSA